MGSAVLGRVVDFSPGDRSISAGQVGDISDIVPSGVHIPEYENEGGSPYSYQSGPYSISAQIGFRVPTAAEIQDPANWTWQRTNAPEVILMFGDIQAAYQWGSSPWRPYASASGTLQQGMVLDAQNVALLPPELLELVEHPDRIRVGASTAGYRARVLGFGFTIAQPVPEPSAFALLAAALGFGLVRGSFMPGRKSRASIRPEP